MTCRKCKHLDVQPDKAGRIVPRKEKVYRCMVEMDRPVFPSSVTRMHGFTWPPDKSWMEPDDGADCPLFENRNSNQ